MTSAAANRLVRELKDLSAIAKSSNTDSIDALIQHLQPDEESLFQWVARIRGPEGTPYAGGLFEFHLSIPDNYPHSPPSLKCITKIFHPNIHYKTGEVCLDILKTEWSPAWTLEAVCRALGLLLQNPEADSPLNCDAGNLIRSGDTRGYSSLAKMYTQLYANGSNNTSTSTLS